MALVIKSKFFCNDVDFASNKTKKPASVNINVARIVKRYDDLGVVVLKPHIDRIVLGFFVSEALLAQYTNDFVYDEFLHYVPSTLFGEAKNNPESGLTPVSGVPFFKKPYCDYNVSLHFRPKPKSVPILIQAGPKNPKNPLLRIDMNPSHYNSVEMKKFRNKLEELFVMPGGSIPYSVRSRSHLSCYGSQ